MTAFLLWLFFAFVLFVIAIMGLVIYLLVLQRKELEPIEVRYVDEWKRPRPR